MNCSQHITERFTTPEVAEAVAGLRERLAKLEAENARLRAEPAGPVRRKNRQHTDAGVKQSQPVRKDLQSQAVIGQYYCPNW